MIFNKVLNHIFSSRSRIAVLRVLQHYKIGITGREIARLTGLSPKSALSALSLLENIKIIKRVIGGRDHLFTLNRDNYLVKNGILPILQIENKILSQLLLLIKQKLSKHCISIILFGSIARKEESADSDLDICFVVLNKSYHKHILPIIHDLQDRIFTEFGTSLAPIYFTLDEFKKKSAKNLSPVNNIIKDGILISGKTIRDLTHGS